MPTVAQRAAELRRLIDHHNYLYYVEARTEMCDQLRAVGFATVTMLSKPSLLSEVAGSAPRVAAA